jgi:branched-chain amino acid transport system ATP-binding protein
VDDLELEIPAGGLYGLIGPNGAGKTTVFNVITGVYNPTRGRILFGGKEIQGLKPHQIARRGITRTFQNIRLFHSRCCRDNVCIASHQHASAGLLAAVLRTRAFERDEKELMDRADELLDVMGLTEWDDVRSAELPYGQQRRLEIARALAGRPKLLLLDEPAAGLNPQESDDQVAVVLLSNKAADGAQESLRAMSAKIVQLAAPVELVAPVKPAAPTSAVSPSPSSADAPPPGR